MECTNNAGCPQHVITYSDEDITEFKARGTNIRGIEGVQQKEIVMGLARRRRTRATVAGEAEAVGSLGEGVIAFEFARAGRDIVDDPVVEATVNGGIVIGHE